MDTLYISAKNRSQQHVGKSLTLHWTESGQTLGMCSVQAQRRSSPVAADQYPRYADRSGDDLLAAVRDLSLNGGGMATSGGASDGAADMSDSQAPQSIGAAEAAGG